MRKADVFAQLILRFEHLGTPGKFSQQRKPEAILSQRNQRSLLDRCGHTSALKKLLNVKMPPKKHTSTTLQKDYRNKYQTSKACTYPASLKMYTEH